MKDFEPTEEQLGQFGNGQMWETGDEADEIREKMGKFFQTNDNTTYRDRAFKYINPFYFTNDIQYFAVHIKQPPKMDLTPVVMFTHEAKDKQKYYVLFMTDIDVIGANKIFKATVENGDSFIVDMNQWHDDAAIQTFNMII